jgi:superfamily II DNA/RNA helicase
METAFKHLGEPRQVFVIHGSYHQCRRDKIVEKFCKEEADIPISCKTVPAGTNFPKVCDIVMIDESWATDVFVASVNLTDRVGNEGKVHALIRSDEDGRVSLEGDTV